MLFSNKKLHIQQINRINRHKASGSDELNIICYAEMYMHTKHHSIYNLTYVSCVCLFFCFVYLMVFNATFNNISVISWRSVLLVEETGGPRRKPPTCRKSLTNLRHVCEDNYKMQLINKCSGDQQRNMVPRNCKPQVVLHSF